MSAPIQHTARLPFGYRATFIWSNGRMDMEWQPDRPCIKSARAWSKFRQAYDAERRTFMQDIATTIGGSILVADLDGVMEVVRPGVKH